MTLDLFGVESPVCEVAEVGEFHHKDGWFFKRLDHGSVQIRVADYLHGDHLRLHVISANEWASIVAHVAVIPNDGQCPAYEPNWGRCELPVAHTGEHRSGIGGVDELGPIPERRWPISAGDATHE